MLFAITLLLLAVVAIAIGMFKRIKLLLHQLRLAGAIHGPPTLPLIGNLHKVPLNSHGRGIITPK